MTTVRLERDGGAYSVEAKDHATGSAEMCAAVSCLVYTLAGYLRNVECVDISEMTLEPGDARIVWSGGTDEPWLMTVIGFLQLQAGDSDHIRVVVTEA